MQLCWTPVIVFSADYSQPTDNDLYIYNHSKFAIRLPTIWQNVGFSNLQAFQRQKELSSNFIIRKVMASLVRKSAANMWCVQKIRQMAPKLTK